MIVIKLNMPKDNSQTLVDRTFEEMCAMSKRNILAKIMNDCALTQNLNNETHNAMFYFE